jgi:ATP-dependent Clp protease ATP-binding subunit ClpA
LFRRDGPPRDLRPMLAGAAREARERGRGRIEVEDVMIGALEDAEGGAARTARALDLDVEALRAELRALLEAQPA